MHGKDKATALKYERVTQQRIEPICGVMAIAFAFSCFLGHNPALLHYNISAVQMHLKHCIANACINSFPFTNIHNQQRKEEIWNTSWKATDVHGKMDAHELPTSQLNSESMPYSNNQQTTANPKVSKSNFLHAYKIPKFSYATNKEPDSKDKRRSKADPTETSKNITNQSHSNSQLRKTQIQRHYASNRTKL